MFWLLVLCWGAATLGLWIFGDFSLSDSYVIGAVIALSVGVVALAVLCIAWLCLTAFVDLLGL